MTFEQELMEGDDLGRTGRSRSASATPESNQNAAVKDVQPSFTGAKRLVYKRQELLVDTYGAIISNPTFVLEKDIQFIRGVYLTTNKEEKIFQPTIRLEINGEEIFPADYEAHLLFSYSSVPMNERVKLLNMFPAGNGSVKWRLLDTTGPNGAIPVNDQYKVSLYLECIKVSV